MKNAVVFLILVFSLFSFSQSDSLKPALHDPSVFPVLKIKGLLTVIDSASQKKLNAVYNFMIENPTAVISITSLFEHEMDVTPFAERSKIIAEHLFEMGIPQERLLIKIAKYSEQRDADIQSRKAGNVVFAVESFDYKK